MKYVRKIALLWVLIAVWAALLAIVVPNNGPARAIGWLLFIPAGLAVMIAAERMGRVRKQHASGTDETP